MLKINIKMVFKMNIVKNKKGPMSCATWKQTAVSFSCVMLLISLFTLNDTHCALCFIFSTWSVTSAFVPGRVEFPLHFRRSWMRGKSSQPSLLSRTAFFRCPAIRAPVYNYHLFVTAVTAFRLFFLAWQNTALVANRCRVVCVDVTLWESPWLLFLV